MNKLRKIFILLFGIMASVQVMAQDKIVHPCLLDTTTSPRDTR